MNKSSKKQTVTRVIDLNLDKAIIKNYLHKFGNEEKVALETEAALHMRSGIIALFIDEKELVGGSAGSSKGLQKRFPIPKNYKLKLVLEFEK